MPWASCESHLEVSEQEEEEVLGHLQGCSRCLCTAVGMEEFGMEEFGMGRAHRAPLQHTQLPAGILNPRPGCG